LPDAPTDLVESAKTETEITVTWTKVSGATSYIVHYKLSTEEEWINTQDLGDVNTFTITGFTESA
jgi:hypothetical protein